MAEAVIHDGNWQDFIRPTIDGDPKSHGLAPRDYSTHPEGCFAWAEPFPDELLIPEDEIDGRIAEAAATHSTLLDLREMYYAILKSLDQDGLGLCWAFSTTKCMMYLRALMNEPGIILSAWWVAGIVKGWADQGGWGGESLAQIVKSGVPAMSFCPSYRSSYDTAECRANAALHKCISWWEGSSDPEKAWHQMASASVGLRLPCISDWNWWGHSTCTGGIVSYKDPQSVTDNSWGESAGDKGLYYLKGSKTLPDGLWIPRVQTPAVT